MIFFPNVWSGAGRAATRVAPLVERGPDPTVTVDDLWLTLPQQASLIYQAARTRSAAAKPLPEGREACSLTGL
jgi:hypothetical protein